MAGVYLNFFGKPLEFAGLSPISFQDMLDGPDSPHLNDDDAEFLAEMRDDFLEKLSGELEECEACLLRFEASGDEAALTEFRRLVHTLKGGGRMVELNELSSFLHGLETRLQKATQEGCLKEFVLFALPLLDLLRAYTTALRGEGDAAGVAAKIADALAK